jgi:hypothetical protein
VDGSTDNSAFAMVFGYNLLTRFDAGGQAANVGGIGWNVGEGHSWLIVFQPNMASQITWLLPMCAVTLVAGLLWRRHRPRTDKVRAGFLMWGLWLGLHIVAFSVGNVAHTFYTAIMAPAIAALTGAGVVMFGKALRGGRPLAWGLPLGVALTAAWTARLAFAYPTFLPWLIAVALLLTVVAVALLATALGAPATRWLGWTALTVGVLAMLAEPAGWAASTLVPPYGGTKIGPAAGPTQTLASGGFGGGPSRSGPGPGGFRGGPRPGFGGGGGFASGPTPELVAFLKAHQGGARYAVAIPESNTAGPYIMAGLSVLPIGGFSGQVPYPTEVQLRDLVADGQLRYVLVAGGRAGGSAVLTWVADYCGTVQVAGTSLYDCIG